MAYQDNYAAVPVPRLVLYSYTHSEVERAILTIINACNEPPYGSLEDAAIALDDLRPSRRLGSHWNPSESERPFLREFWPTFLQLACQIPCSDITQDYLVTIINELRSLHRPDDRTANIWNNASELSRGINSIWLGKADDDYHVCQRYVNLNAFVSRLYNDDLVDCYGLGIKAMRRVFESGQSRSDMLVICRIQAATQWMLYSAKKLFALMTVYRPGHRDQDTYGSALFSGNMAFSFERWMYWKRSFGNLCDAEGDDADLAVASMDRADGFCLL
ncbi:hypothetical protein F4813DRAFT_391849 [Daldinia decipiens]|uniref:uncharacterized protein n=1 Tax=Daldinia decipiens TaxID=326647 RepID=UPI0020C2569C|nr:uncharacterized protein F4813DRAFT_391849 [Daldinia decipiens]KAI1655132.1 hypothetical protein F4813DRAFT_391849 [Daldinia decipiens]